MEAMIMMKSEPRVVAAIFALLTSYGCATPIFVGDEKGAAGSPAQQGDSLGAGGANVAGAVADPSSNVPPAPTTVSDPTSCGLPFGKGDAVFDDRPGNTYAIAYSRDGAMVATAAYSSKPNVKIFRASDNALLQELEGHEFAAYSVAFSPDGAWLASAGWAPSSDVNDGTDAAGVVKIWRTSDGALLQVVPVSTGAYGSSVEFSHDGTMLATSGHNHNIEIWRVADGQRLLSIAYEGTVYTARFSPDDQLLVTSGTQNEANLWAVADGTLRAVLTGHTNSVSDAVFSPDGTQVVTAGYDNTARIWNVADGALVQVLVEHEDVTNLSTQDYLSQAVWYDADHIVTNDWGGGLRVWARGTDGAFAAACSRSLFHQSLGLAVSPDGKELRAGGGNEAGTQSEGVWVIR
jgi:WD40 repeat protein